MKNKILVAVLAVLFCSVLGFGVLAASKKKITLKRDKTVIVLGEKVKLSGQIKPKKKKVVIKLYTCNKKKGTYKFKKQAKTNKKGDYHFHVKTKATKYYRTQFVVDSKIIKSEAKKVTVGTNPVLRNLMLDMESYNSTTGKAGAFLFGSFNSDIFLEFGATVAGEGGDKMLPTFEYRPDPNALVYATSYGIVSNVDYQASTDDYEILVYTTSTGGSMYIDYDHIKNPAVKAGDVVQAGTILGNPGAWSEGLGRTEVMLNEPFSNGVYSYCPFDYFEPKLKSEYMQKVTNLMNDWETYKNDSSIYNQDAMVEPGCLYHKMIDDGGDVRPANY